MLQPRAEQKAETLGAVIPHGEHGGAGENQRHEQQQAAAQATQVLAEGIRGERNAGQVAGILPGAGQQNDQRGAGADNQRVSHWPEHGDQALSHRLVGACGTVGHDLGAHTRLIGKDTAAHADQDDPHQTAAHRLRVECVGDDAGQQAG